ncbi:MAG: hypothetical protein KC586_11995, partial [Myxococcales bacterium]|nr:hypothetical protein [Myxococcales bacterium]
MRRGCVVGVVGLLCAWTAKAQPPVAPEASELEATSETTEAPVTQPAAATRPRPLAITISGAASLGAYEAGYVHYVVETLRGSGTIEPEAFVGTSAGSVNALLGVLSSCMGPAHDPRTSLFWRTWMPIGAEGLHDPERTSPIALFNRGRFDEAAAPLEQLFAHGLPETCDRLLGAAITRVRPETLAGGSALAMPRMAERFLLRVRGRGVGTPIEVSNHRLPRLDLPRLAVEGEGARPFEAVRDLLFASSAFP